MKIAVVYSSKTGNTEELADLICGLFLQKKVEVSLYRIEHFPMLDINRFDGIVIGTYTWGNGEIPLEMMELYRAFETQAVKGIVTGVIGTGDSGYPAFCGAVDEFRNMLFVHTQLTVTLKIEVTPQKKDLERCQRFVDILLEHIYQQK